MWESRCFREISKTLWERWESAFGFQGFHSVGISIALRSRYPHAHSFVPGHRCLRPYFPKSVYDVPGTLCIVCPRSGPSTRHARVRAPRGYLAAGKVT